LSQISLMYSELPSITYSVLDCSAPQACVS
jgi:hypothetical protein